METRKGLGFMYLAKRPCGRVSAMCWDEPGFEKDTAKHVAEYIRRGDKVSVLSGLKAINYRSKFVGLAVMIVEKRNGKQRHQ